MANLQNDVNAIAGNLGNTITALANLQNDVNAIAGNLNQFQNRVATMYQDVEKSKNVDKEDLRKKTVAVNDLTNRVYKTTETGNKTTETKDRRKQETRKIPSPPEFDLDTQAWSKGTT